MNLNEWNNHFNIRNSFPQEPQNKSELDNILSENKNSELIKKEYEVLLKNIETIIAHNFLKKEYYENLPDWTNPEIDNICNHSATDIENRIKAWKWVLYMNPCISQTLYLVNKLKKEFPHLSEKMELCIEVLKLSKLNIRSVHTFIQINLPNKEPIIIDYARDNDVYIYYWPYNNKSSHAIETESLHTIPANSFGENDNIFDMAVKSNILEEWEFDEKNQQLHNDFFSEILNSRKEHLISDNSKSRFERRKKTHGKVRIFNYLYN